MHLNKKGFANAMAATTVVAMLVFYILLKVAPSAFEFVFNAQFLGGDFASRISAPGVGDLVGMLVAMGVLGWVMGWLIAYFYNKFSK